MKAFIFFAIFVLLSQAHVHVDFTDFFKKFVSRLPMDAQIKTKIESDGLACLDLTSQAISHSIHAFHHGDHAISSLREFIGTVQIVEGSLLPKCFETYQQIMSFFGENANLSQINTPAKTEMFRAKLIQIATRVFIELSQNQTLDAAQDLTLFLETAFGLIRVYLPPTLEFNSTKYVSFNHEKAAPLILKGFFGALDVRNQTKINGTIQCIVGVVSSIEATLQQFTSGRGDILTQTNTFLDHTMIITDAFEKCHKLQKISLESVQNIINVIRNHPEESLLKMVGGTIMKLPDIKQSEINMAVYLKQGEYELAGQQLGINLLRVYQGLLL